MYFRVMNTKAPTRQQGKLDERIIIEELLKRPRKKGWEIAKMAGSKGKDKLLLAQSLSKKVATSVNIQNALEADREAQRKRAFLRQKKADELMDWEKLREKPELAWTVIRDSEKLLHESVKVSKDDIKEKEKNEWFKDSDKLTPEETFNRLQQKKEEIARLERLLELDCVDGEVAE